MSQDYKSLSTLCPVISYNEANNLFSLDDKTLGFMFECTPLPGNSHGLEDKLKSLFSLDFPIGSLMSFFLYRSPDVDQNISNMLNMRIQNQDKLLTPIVIDRCNFIRNKSTNHIVAKVRNGYYDSGIVVDIKLFISVKVPVRDGNNPNLMEIEKVTTLKNQINSSLTEIGFRPQICDARKWLRIISTLVNWSEHASWRNSQVEWNEEVPLNEQYFDYDCELDYTNNTGLYFGLNRKNDTNKEEEGAADDCYDCYVQVLSPKHFPPYSILGNAISYIGDNLGTDRTIKENYAIVGHVYFPDHLKEVGAFNKKKVTTGHFAYSSLIKTQPKLGFANKDLETYTLDLTTGGKALKLIFSAIIFAPTKKRLEAASVALMQQFEVDKFKLLPDRYIQREMFSNALPLFTEIGFIAGKQCNRTFSMTSNTVSLLLPIFSEWKGTGTPHIFLISRTGQLMSLSLHDSNTNKNAIIAAESGAGKSFFTNELITMYRSEGAKIFTIDIGRSYVKLSDVLHGEFISFEEDKMPCLNPFDTCYEYEEDRDALIGILETMISPKSQLEDLQHSIVSRVLDEQWEKYHQDLNIDLIQQALEEEYEKQKDIRIHDMVEQIYQFTSKGSYGKFFNGKSNVNWKNMFTVLELQELDGRPDLRKVVVQLLIFQIKSQIYLSRKDEYKKIVIIDEGWKLLEEGHTAHFIMEAYRTFRKYNGSIILVTQSLNDLKKVKEGDAIAENSATMFLLKQNPETLDKLKDGNSLSFNEGEINYLKSVKTVAGAFSEICVKSNAGIGVGRLIVSDFQKLLYTTNPEELLLIKKYVDQGLNYADAINKVLIDRNQYIDYSIKPGQDPNVTQEDVAALIKEKPNLFDFKKTLNVFKIAKYIQNLILTKKEEEEAKENKSKNMVA